MAPAGVMSPESLTLRLLRAEAGAGAPVVTCALGIDGNSLHSVDCKAKSGFVEGSTRKILGPGVSVSPGPRVAYLRLAWDNVKNRYCFLFPWMLTLPLLAKWGEIFCASVSLSAIRPFPEHPCEGYFGQPV